ncbi:peptide chain release factor N(5)-glutamine methyltransferase [Psychroserpens sp.]|uniref:peptide chain release factor N(5)-glutamine methyltransferase n=1 Tax=Psychroserpens sp. TaxID=2020870 RepID=UPI001B155EAF|nr:peptide chain release factor N(5)-glutamine methyltransferase [Psychroserpens sp.]MBO6606813.1 peptide chain release factor N(5)-glutamine methyltransferase [Psychroserpens sp.]MBO6653516.1 peptide chain release factor N(5)-glutamine methyltransferase [Psychroserpens sp.]MBO6680456.1 peptide chain release factor N(5)-glutamine methyltransferase [Psychroserpens sp.]MBO6750585.1 peptide chain release factor N(5)-glutamine methyltransferase [Psychroserpens sp.]MBO6915068.1 peptide chain releas
MRLKDIEHIFHQELDNLYNPNEVTSFFNWLIEHYLSLKPLDMIMNPEYAVTKLEEQPLFQALSDLKQYKPIQYILGSTEFYGLTFNVNSYTLIPRPETEELVSKIITDYSSHSNDSKLTILDIGTGSGCIAVTLAKHLLNAQVTAIDISEDALKTAKENAELNDVDISFIKSDILDYSDLTIDHSSFDVIVSNPPYVRNSEKSEIRPNVLDHEPHQALFVDDNDPLVFYRSICEFALDHLKPKGILYFEINEYLGTAMLELVAAYEFETIELIKDMSGKDRMLKAVRC